MEINKEQLKKELIKFVEFLNSINPNELDSLQTDIGLIESYLQTIEEPEEKKCKNCIHSERDTLPYYFCHIDNTHHSPDYNCKEFKFK
jgi:hypothetical protein